LLVMEYQSMMKIIVNKKNVAITKRECGGGVCSPIIRALESRRVGELESFRVGELESWRAGELESWRAGELESFKAAVISSWIDILQGGGYTPSLSAPQ